MNTDAKLYGRDNYGNVWGPLDPKAPKRSLLDSIGATTARPMFCDKKDGRTVQTGYVVAPARGSNECELWVRFYTETVQPWEKERI